MRRVSVVVAMVAAVVLGWAAPASAGGSYKADRAVKLDVMGEWAHPDDDTSIIGPCGVWHARYGVKCGIIMVTRGEGGGNAVGQEIGPALGLRRENEDRVAHFRWALERDGSALISFETPAGEVQAFDISLARRRPGG